MARTTEAAVKLIVETSLGTTAIEALIDDASLFVDENLLGQGLSASLLTSIEKYLAAHLVTVRDPLLHSRRRDDITDTFLRDQNPYLKYAIQLDPTGAIEEAFAAEDKPSFSAYVGAGYDDDLSLGVDVP